MIAGQRLRRLVPDAWGPFTRMALAYLLLALGLAARRPGRHDRDGLAYVLPVVVWSLGDVILLGEPFAVVAELAHERDRGRYLAAYGVSWGLATTVGPLLTTGLVAGGGPPLLWLTCAALSLMLAAGQSPSGPRLPKSRIGAMSNDFPLFALSEEHQAIREAVRDLCEAKIAPYAAEVDEESALPGGGAGGAAAGRLPRAARARGVRRRRGRRARHRDRDRGGRPGLRVLRA